MRFWPDIIAKDLALPALAIVVLVLLAHFVGAGLEPPADPTDSTYVPRPEWYFLPFFQLLKLVPGSMEARWLSAFPRALLLVLLMLPFFDRRSMRSILHRPIAAISMIACSPARGCCSVKRCAKTANRDRARNRPITYAVERAGRALFKRHQCGSCHQVGNQKADTNEDTPHAPELTEVGLKHTEAWMHSFIEDPGAFMPTRRCRRLDRRCSPTRRSRSSRSTW